MILWALGAFSLVCLAIHLVSVGLVLMRSRNPRQGVVMGQPFVCLLRPVCGLDPFDEETLTTSFTLSYRNMEVIFCVASAQDPVIPLVRRLIAAHPQRKARLLIGEDAVSGNPKLNNLAKGWAASAADWIVMSDSNVLLLVDYVETLLSCWRSDTGLVTAPPIGVRGIGLWGAVECAFLNTYQARWQLAADQLGIGFAQGKTLFWRRDVLDRVGGIAALGHDLAEDVASTKLVRAAGRKVHLVPQPFAQPIGRRSFAAVWGRQLRWARVRRAGFLALFIPEIFAGAAFPTLAFAAGMAGLGLPVAGSLAFAGLWYLAEFVLARVQGWEAGPRDVMAWVVRDAMLPVLWLFTWGGSGFVWRGTEMGGDDVVDLVAAE